MKVGNHSLFAITLLCLGLLGCQSSDGRTQATGPHKRATRVWGQTSWTLAAREVGRSPERLDVHLNLLESPEQETLRVRFEKTENGDCKASIIDRPRLERSSELWKTLTTVDRQGSEWMIISPDSFDQPCEKANIPSVQIPSDYLEDRDVTPFSTLDRVLLPTPYAVSQAVGVPDSLLLGTRTVQVTTIKDFYQSIVTAIIDVDRHELTAIAVPSNWLEKGFSNHSLEVPEQGTWLSMHPLYRDDKDLKLREQRRALGCFYTYRAETYQNEQLFAGKNPELKTLIQYLKEAFDRVQRGDREEQCK